MSDRLYLAIGLIDKSYDAHMKPITSGTDPSVVATRPGSFLAAYLFRWDENDESWPWDGWTETMTSLARYAIRATIRIRLY